MPYIAHGRISEHSGGRVRLTNGLTSQRNVTTLPSRHLLSECRIFVVQSVSVPHMLTVHAAAVQRAAQKRHMRRQ